MRPYIRTSVALALALAGASSRDDSKTPSPPVSSGAGAPTTAAPTVTPTGKVIIVEMFTDEKGNYFKPARIEAHRGDMIRFTLGAGVHNVHFLPDSNPGQQGLPPVSDFLQLPGQTYDLLITLAPGEYYFQCDPHALLGMIGRLEVEDEK